MVFAPVACRSVEAFIIGFSPRLLANAGMTVSTPSTKAPGDIILGFLLYLVRKQFRRLPALVQLPLDDERAVLCIHPTLLHTHKLYYTTSNPLTLTTFQPSPTPQ